MSKRVIKKKHRPGVALGFLITCLPCAYMSYRAYLVGVTSEFNGAAMLGHLFCYLWFLAVVICFEFAFEFHIGRRQVSAKRNHPILAFASLALAIGSFRLAYEVVTRALEARHFDLAFGFYLAAVWAVTAVAFIAVAFEFQSRRASK